MKPSHLLIDLDGTLLDEQTLSASWTFVSKFLRYGGRRIGHFRTLKGLKALSKELEKKSSSEKNAIRLAEAFSKGCGLAIEPGTALLYETTAYVFPKISDFFKPMFGASEFIEWAKDKYQLILATNPVWPVEFVELRLKWASIDPSHFSFITHAENMTSIKPSAEYYESILKKNNLKKENVFLVGNDPKMDLPATFVGIPCFLVKQKQKIRPLQIACKEFAPAWSGDYTALQKLLTKS